MFGLFLFALQASSFKLYPSEQLFTYDHINDLLKQIKEIVTLTPVGEAFHKWFLFLGEKHHESGNTLELAKRVHQYLTEMGIYSYIDKTGNVIAKINATKGREFAASTLLQSHLDQVDTRKGSDLEKPIYNVIEGDRLVGYNSSNGADGTLGDAMMLAIAEYAHTFNHGPIELFFSVDEETSFVGVLTLNGTEFMSKYYICLDAAQMDLLLIGAAGAVDLL